MSIALLIRVEASRAPCLESWISHLAGQFPAATGERTLVLERSRAPRQRGTPAHDGGALAARLLERGTIDRVIDARGAPPANLEAIRCLFPEGSAPDGAWLTASGAPWGVLAVLASSRRPYVLMLESPVFFHIGTPSWIEEGVNRLERDRTAWIVRAAFGPPTPEPVRAPARDALAGHFLCETARLRGQLDAKAWLESRGSVERWLLRSRPAAPIDADRSGGWGVRVPSFEEPFSAWAGALGDVIARGRYPEQQRGRYDIRLDRAIERESWGRLLEGPRREGSAAVARGRPRPARALEVLPGPRPLVARAVEPGTPSSCAPVVLLAPYFTRNGNPLLGRPTYQPDRCELVEPWWSDVNRLGIEGRIFHDELSPAFVDRYTTPRIAFEQHTLPAGVSCNDYRFLVFRDWLRRHAEVEFAFCTDLFDIRVKKDPFEVLGGGRHVYAGAQPSTIGQNRFVLGKLARAYDRSFPELAGKVVLNAGILGGPRDLLLPCLDALAADLEAAFERRPSGNYNMGVFNRVLHGLDSLWARGEPLHSRFRARDFGADVCFVHK